MGEGRGTGNGLAVVGSTLYGLATDKSGVYRFSGTPNVWTKVGGPAGTLYGGKAGLLATSPDNSNVYRYDAGSGTWSWIGASGESFVVTDTMIYRLDKGKNSVSAYPGSPSTTWIKVRNTYTTQIYGGGSTLLATGANNNWVWRYKGAGSWEAIGVGAGSYAVSGNIIYSLNKAGTAVYRYNGDPGSWTQIGGLAVSISRC